MVLMGSDQLLPYGVAVLLGVSAVLATLLTVFLALGRTPRHAPAPVERVNLWVRVGNPGGELGGGEMVSTGRGSDERAR